jgi:O-methyltransferase involved in polyketide biosynthesis
VSEPPRSGSDAIGPTAHYTGYVWSRHGLSAPELTTGLGRVLFSAARPANALSSAVGGPTLEELLLARHRLIDHLLEEAIVAGRVSQVLEIACGMSPRGLRFAERHGDALTYVEADLPAMASRKREALERAGSLSGSHRVVEIDALAASGPRSVSSVTGRLDAHGGLAIITEGLLPYLERDAVLALWRRIADALEGFAGGVYLADLNLTSDNRGLATQAFLAGLGVFVRGRVALHFDTAPEAEAALLESGFGSATVHRPEDFAGTVEIAGKGAELVRVIEAGR